MTGFGETSCHITRQSVRSRCRLEGTVTSDEAPWHLARKLPCLWGEEKDNRRLTWEEERVDAYRALRQQLLQRLAHLEGRLDKVEHDRRRGTNALDPDWEEQATVRQNDEVLDELAEEERLQASAIRVALQRMDDGSYGWCVTCGEPIAPRRLAVLPYATQCIACVTRAEHQGRAGR